MATSGDGGRGCKVLNFGLLVGEGGGRVGESSKWVWQGALVASAVRGKGEGEARTTLEREITPFFLQMTSRVCGGGSFPSYRAHNGPRGKRAHLRPTTQNPKYS